MFPLQRILCPTDLSADSRAALAAAGEAARYFGAQLAVLHVCVPAQPAVWPYEGLGISPYTERVSREETLALRRDELKREVDRVLPGDLDLKLLVLAGDPAQAILTAAEQFDADLIVIAPHKHNRLRKAILSSTTEEVVKNAACPVIMMPAKHPVTAQTVAGLSQEDRA